MMDIFTLEPLAARHGDCLLLHFGPATKPGTILIDGGPSTVWGTSLKPRLARLAKARPGGPFAIDLAMVSHIDDDHIRGIIDMTDDWRDAKTDQAAWPFPIRQLWHNSFERIAGSDFTKVKASLLSSFGVTDLPQIAERNGDDGHDHDALATNKILASVGQGSALRNNAKLIALPVNTGFDGLVHPGPGGSPYKLGDLELHVVGPLPKQLADLQKQFAKELPKGNALAAYTDTSIPNLSSIVVLVRYKGKTILLTGDARGDYIIEGLKQAKLLTNGKLHLDILKMPHHASSRDLADDFFKTVTADHYVASADGQYENPDRETLEMLARVRPKADKYVIHLTYEVDAIDKLRKAERDKAVAGAKPGKGPSPWNDEKDSLKAFFAACKKDGHAFTVETPATRKRASIDLLDPIGF